MLHWSHYCNTGIFPWCKTYSLLPVTHITDFLSCVRLFSSFSLQQMTGSKGQELCRDCAWLLKKRSLQHESAVCVCVRATQMGRQAVLTRMWIVCAQRCDTRCESYSTNNVLLGTGTISALCGRTVALLLKSQASSNLLFYWQTIQQHWHAVSEYHFYRYRDTMQIFSPLLPKLRCTEHCQSWMYSSAPPR